MANLTTGKVDALLKRGEVGDHKDGAGLFLRIAKPRPNSGAKHGSVKWYIGYRFGFYEQVFDVERGVNVGQKRHKNRTLYLGDFSEVSVKDARTRAAEVHEAHEQGGDPHKLLNYARGAAVAAMSIPSDLDGKYAVPAAQIVMVHEDSIFEQVARLYHQNNRAKFTSAKYYKAWLSELEPYFKAFGSVPMDQITPAMIVEPLKSQWVRVHDTAKKNAQRLRQIFVFYYATTMNQQSVAMTPVDLALALMPATDGKTKHFNSMPFEDVPAFYAALGDRGAMSAKTLQWIILTATRSQETRGAKWSEVDWDANTWTVPGERLKVKGMERHTVYLTSTHIDFLESMQGIHDGDLIFPNSSGKMQSENVFRPLFRRMGFVEDATHGQNSLPKLTLTAHGFRSSFRTFVEAMTDIDPSIAEMALAHAVGTKVERAYRRDAVRSHKMRELMQIWSDFVTGAVTANQLNQRLEIK